MSTHEKYNLKFANRVDRDKQIMKACEFINEMDQTYGMLWYYLIQIQHIENISEILPNLLNILSGDEPDDYFSSGTTWAYVRLDGTTISHRDGTELTLPTSDFIEILEEYMKFLKSK